MTDFIVIFLGLIALVLLLVPLALQLFREVDMLRSYVRVARQEVADTIRQSEYYRMACETASDGIIIQDMKGRIVWCNPAYCDLLGRDEADILGRNPLSFAMPDDLAMTATEIDDAPFDLTEGTLHLCRNKTADGGEFWNQINIKFRRSADGRENSIAVCRNVTEQVAQDNQLLETKRRLQIEATHDSLTGTHNRGAFLAFLDKILLDKEMQSVGIVHVDLDNFKDINDTHGHSAGDAVLIHAAQVLNETVRPCDMVARVGGDEFVIVCPDIETLGALEALTRCLERAIIDPFDWNDRILQFGASFGAACAPTAECNVEDLLVQSDFALYQAKRRGRDQVMMYDEDMHARHTTETRRTEELIATIDTAALDYFFQPTLSLETGEVVGVETLVRWIHPEEGIIPPDEFLPLVKEQGLMGALDLCSMNAALHHKRKLNDTGFAHLTVAFNASPELLAHPEFINRLIWGVEAAGIDRAQISIEVLESTNFEIGSTGSANAAIIRDLCDAGFQVQLDDFGIGYAGLTHLAQLNVTGVKIDRGLVKDILIDEASRKIVRKIVELSIDLGLTVIAEGIEDVETADLLRDMGCPTIQGYWVSKPISAPDLDVWLAGRVTLPKQLRA